MSKITFEHTKIRFDKIWHILRQTLKHHRLQHLMFRTNLICDPRRRLFMNAPFLPKLYIIFYLCPETEIFHYIPSWTMLFWQHHFTAMITRVHGNFVCSSCKIYRPLLLTTIQPTVPFVRDTNYDVSPSVCRSGETAIERFCARTRWVLHKFFFHKLIFPWNYIVMVKIAFFLVFKPDKSHCW